MSAWADYKKKLGTTRPWDVLNPNAPKATEEEAEHRLSICESCPELIRLPVSASNAGVL